MSNKKLIEFGDLSFMLVLILILLIFIISIYSMKYNSNKGECQELINEGYDAEFILNMSLKSRNPMWTCSIITTTGAKGIYSNGRIDYNRDKEIIARR